MRSLGPFGRLAAIPIAILIGILLAELGLQLGALAVKAAGREAPASWMTGHRRVLCLGDSNTYGIYLEPEQAYPKQLESLWNDTVGSPRIETINVAIPGTNSSQILRDLPRLFGAFMPDVVIVLVGTNDFITPPVPLEEPSGSAARVKRFLESSSRFYRLLYSIRGAYQANQLEVEWNPFLPETVVPGVVRYGDEEFSLGGFKLPGRRGNARVLFENLRAMAGQAEDFDAKLIFMTYPGQTFTYRPANKVIRAAALETGMPLVDLEAVFDVACPERDCEDLFFPDEHPTARGYRLVAESVLAQLMQD
ncbi:MAG: SGNH/GDSL hydrolase family protein [Myxococcota bacterium]